MSALSINNHTILSPKKNIPKRIFFFILFFIFLQLKMSKIDLL